MAVAAGSRCRLGLDHALRKEYQSGKQTEETNQEEEHEHDRKHFAPLGSVADGWRNVPRRACPALIRVKAALIQLTM
jgi:hypothetical protein